MKIQFTPKRVKLLRVTLALIAISLAGYVAYAATTLSVSNTATITSGANILITPLSTTNPVNCPAHLDGTYTLTPPAVAWTIPAGSSQTQYFCIDNRGTGSTAGTITFTLVTATGLSGAPLTYTALAAGTATASPIAFIVSATPTATSGSFNIVVN
jgi:hypothetical protein